MALLFRQQGLDQGEDAHADEYKAHAHAGHDHSKDHAAHGAAGEEAEEAERALSLEEIESETCEHDTTAYTCEECRYEVGVVKVPASLIRETPSDVERLIETAPVSLRRVVDGMQVTGEVRLNENASVHISPRIPGVIDTVNVDIGATVKKGEPLLSINSAVLGEAHTNYQRSRSLTALSRKVYEREKELFERKITSEQDMIEAQMAYEQHKTEKNAAEQARSMVGNR